MVNYASGFNQSETGKYFEWIIKSYIIIMNYSGQMCWQSDFIIIFIVVFYLHLQAIFTVQLGLPWCHRQLTCLWASGNNLLSIIISNMLGTQDFNKNLCSPWRFLKPQPWCNNNIIIYNSALMNQTMFLKFMLFNQNMFCMNHHPSSVVQWKIKWSCAISRCHRVILTCSEDCFKILNSASTSFHLKIKAAMHILWEQPSLNSQVKHLNLSLSY